MSDERRLFVGPDGDTRSLYVTMAPEFYPGWTDTQGMTDAQIDALVMQRIREGVAEIRGRAA